MGAGPFTVFAPNDDAFADAAKALKVTKVELMVRQCRGLFFRPGIILQCLSIALFLL